jgi:hypothetical protein
MVHASFGKHDRANARTKSDQIQSQFWKGSSNLRRIGLLEIFNFLVDLGDLRANDTQADC